MSQPQLTGIVIKADGSVPFDEGHDPEVRKQIIAHLIDRGMDVERIEGTPHLRIKGWDLADGEVKARFHKAGV